MTLFLRLLDVHDKAATLRSEVTGVGPGVFEVDPMVFNYVPGSPFAYWVRDEIRRCFAKWPDAPFTAKLGLKTDDDFRFIRIWFEVKKNKTVWAPFAKGGAFSSIYSDIHLILNWRNDGSELKALSTQRWGNAGKRIFNEKFYFRPGITWPRRTDGLSFRVMPIGCIFADKGPAAFVEDDDSKKLLAILAIINSRPFGYLVSVQLARTELAQSYEVGLIQQTPIPDTSEITVELLATLTLRAWSLKRTIDSITETSHAFLLPAALRSRLGAFDSAIINGELEKLQTEIDDHAFRLYGFEGEERVEIEAWAGKGMSTPSIEAGTVDEDAGADDEGFSASDNDALLSWCVGVTFGRFDVRLATGERAILSEPDPFDPLPEKSPGMLPDGDEQFGASMGIFADDSGHSGDLRSSVANVLERVALPVPENLRYWLAEEFFLLHVKLYSKSRRKAPIYWQLATPSASYSVWIYVHAFNKDTLYRVQNDFAASKLRHEERKLESMRSEAGADPKSEARKALAEQESFVEELQTFLEEIKRVAPLWNPNLDDGVVINFAPLWRLVPQHKAWQKELKSTWDSLCEGEYDWSHLAMHLWPERVVPKCAEDRSLAIAHDLEAVFWNEGVDGKWKKYEIEKSKMAGLIQEKTSTAVKAALKELLEAPYANGSKSGIRNRKAK